jgi:hypothetical protein
MTAAGASEVDLAFVTSGMPDLHPPSDSLEPGFGGVRPFDERHRIRSEVVLEQRRILLVELGEPVEVEVRDRQPAVVGVSDRERRGGHRLPHPEGAGGTADESGLPGSQLPADQHYVTGAELDREPLPQRLGLGGAACPLRHAGGSPAASRSSRSRRSYIARTVSTSSSDMRLVGRSAAEQAHLVRLRLPRNQRLRLRKRLGQ